eukprot:scaffold9992_cov64-Phaeocystis_antarctica.AAC.1
MSVSEVGLSTLKQAQPQGVQHYLRQIDSARVHKVPRAPRLMPKQARGNSLHRPGGDGDRRHPSDDPLRLSEQPPLKRADIL